MVGVSGEVLQLRLPVTLLTRAPRASSELANAAEEAAVVVLVGGSVVAKPVL
jgi:hypothetical protein